MRYLERETKVRGGWGDGGGDGGGGVGWGLSIIYTVERYLHQIQFKSHDVQLNYQSVANLFKTKS